VDEGQGGTRMSDFSAKVETVLVVVGVVVVDDECGPLSRIFQVRFSLSLSHISFIG
jgi:hypothetical protein